MMRTFCSVLLICSVKVVITTKVFWKKYDFKKDNRISNPLATLTTSSAAACCSMCYMSSTCDIVAYNKDRGVCEQGIVELGNNTSAIGWDLYTAKCRAGWEYFDRACFMLDTENLSWTEAQEKCNISNGGRLAYSKTADKDDFLISLISRRYPEGFFQFWIGGTRGASDVFYWGDGTPLSSGFTHWGNSEPSNQQGSEHCLSIRTPELAWNDLRCHKAIFSICEKDLD